MTHSLLRALRAESGYSCAACVHPRALILSRRPRIASSRLLVGDRRAAQTPAYDLVIRNGRIVDGTGSPWYRGDVAVRGDTIARIAPRIERAGDADHRRRGQGRRARVHRSAYARAPRHLPGADGGELRAPGRDDAHGRAGWIVAAADQAVSRPRRRDARVAELRRCSSGREDPRPGDRTGQPQGDRRRDREDARAGAAGDGARARSV